MLKVSHTIKRAYEYDYDKLPVFIKEAIPKEKVKAISLLPAAIAVTLKPELYYFRDLKKAFDTNKVYGLVAVSDSIRIIFG